MKKIILLIILPIFLGSCDLDIKQLKIDFKISGTTNTTSFSEGEILDQYRYFDFNKKNYGTCSSITLVGFIRTKDTHSSCFLELYNLTDSVVISNSTISTNKTSFNWVESQNIVEDLPDKDIDVTIRLRSELDGSWVDLNSASLYIDYGE